MLFSLEFQHCLQQVHMKIFLAVLPCVFIHIDSLTMSVFRAWWVPMYDMFWIFRIARVGNNNARFSIVHLLRPPYFFSYIIILHLKKVKEVVNHVFRARSSVNFFSWNYSE